MINKTLHNYDKYSEYSKNMIVSLILSAREASHTDSKYRGMLDDEDSQRGEVDKAMGKILKNTTLLLFLTINCSYQPLN